MEADGSRGSIWKGVGFCCVMLANCFALGFKSDINQIEPCGVRFPFFHRAGFLQSVIDH